MALPVKSWAQPTVVTDGPRPPRTLRIESRFLAAIRDGRKTWELRMGTFREGDILTLDDGISPLDVRVTYVRYPAPRYDIPENVCIMSIVPLTSPDD